MQNSAVPPLIWIVTSPYILLHEAVFGHFILKLNSLCVVTVLIVGGTERTALATCHVTLAVLW
jgi:hypothetical protein